ncbi:BCCT family transporter [Natronorubrum texcoconense]|uniref:Choline/carnitine/betaine transport n=1 Tax=Natronorubrum texcoconense TaxID=1095776 RepID=A0A1G8U6T0_9EURY|nr:BCCT family transporter [Natronorubrum texcoconense]SDJ48750.1 choline/carnitine/betaine transport [Natronorubrum texcoconense]
MSSDEKGAVDRFFDELDPIVFAFGALLTVGVIVAFFIDRDFVADGIGTVQEQMVGYMNWALLVIVFLIVVFLLFLIVGPWGKIKMGDEDPEYSFFSFFTMLYSAGFAAGVVFWGPTEGLFYYADPNPLFGVEAESSAAMTYAIQQTLFHWALPQLAVFTIMGIAIGYFAYNYDNVPLRVSSALTPILGKENLDGPAAKVIDILAVFATIGGVATSLGFIGSQFISGLDYQWGIDMGDAGILIVVTTMTILFTISMVLGVDKGIRRLSNFNMGLFVVIMIATFIVGPTMFLLLLGSQAMGGMISDFVSMSLYTGAGEEGATGWVEDWTVFYWAWALSWSPFAGLFIARISKGRTIREVAFTGIVATSAATVPWFTFVGGTAVWAQHTGLADFSEVIAPGGPGPEVSGFILFDALSLTLDLLVVEFTVPIGSILILGFMVIVTTFFVTSADSSTLAVSMMTTGGKASPSTINRLFWGIVLGLTAAILMILGGEGGAGALQDAVIITGAPFAIVCFLAVLCLVKDFSGSRGRVLLQEKTVIFGSARGQSDDEPSPAAEPGDDD